jgi:hypothetical protein
VKGVADKEQIERFKEFSDDAVLLQCYKNKIEFGCTYNNAVEQRIYEIEIKMQKIEPDWLDLID